MKREDAKNEPSAIGSGSVPTGARELISNVREPRLLRLRRLVTGEAARLPDCSRYGVVGNLV